MMRNLFRLLAKPEGTRTMWWRMVVTSIVMVGLWGKGACTMMGCKTARLFSFICIYLHGLLSVYVCLKLRSTLMSIVPCSSCPCPDPSDSEPSPQGSLSLPLGRSLFGSQGCLKVADIESSRALSTSFSKKKRGCFPPLSLKACYSSHHKCYTTSFRSVFSAYSP